MAITLMAYANPKLAAVTHLPLIHKLLFDRRATMIIRKEGIISLTLVIS